MHQRLRIRRFWPALTAAAVALGTGAAFGAIPDSGGVIHGSGAAIDAEFDVNVAC